MIEIMTIKKFKKSFNTHVKYTFANNYELNQRNRAIYWFIEQKKKIK